MKMETLLGTILALVLFVLGIWITVAHNRQTKFADLKSEALRLVRAIDFIQEGGQVRVFNNENIGNLILIASEFATRGHPNAASKLMEIHSDISEITMHASHGRLNTTHFAQNFSLWQQSIRNLEPSRGAVWKIGK